MSAARSSNRALVNSEFERAAATFGDRTAGRFDRLGVVGFSRVKAGAVVAEVGAGTGNFLALFAETAARRIAVDLTEGMLRVARERDPAIEAVVADGARLPLASRSIDLVASAQALHHIPDPLPVVKEMRRALAPGASVLIIDQVAPERFEEALAMSELEVMRDPSHAVSRPPSALELIVRAAGLEIVDRRRAEGRDRLSKWMWPGEFPEERIEAVRSFVERRGDQTGMDFERDGDDWTFTRRRFMVLAERARPAGIAYS